MKKILFLVIVVISLFFWPQNIDAQKEPDCRKIFDKESYKCLTDSSACSEACMKETEKPDGSAYFNSGEIYSKCTKASDCDGKRRACNDKALANFRACGKSGKEPEISEAKQETPKQEVKSVVQTIDDWIRENHLEYDPARVEQMERERSELYKKTAQMKEEMFQKAKLQWKSEVIKSQIESLSEPTFEFVWEGQWPDVKAVVFDKESGAIIKSDSWRNIYLQELADQVTKKVILQQGEMEVKVINEKPTENKVNVEVGDFFDIFVIQTHFRVEYDPDKKLGVVNVYEGEVEVRTKDGKVAKIKPDGDPSAHSTSSGQAGSGQVKPGVVVVSRQLSPIKLAVFGAALIALTAGLVLIVRKKR